MLEIRKRFQFRIMSKFMFKGIEGANNTHSFQKGKEKFFGISSFKVLMKSFSITLFVLPLIKIANDLQSVCFRN